MRTVRSTLVLATLLAAACGGTAATDDAGSPGADGSACAARGFRWAGAVQRLPGQA
jgi:hypothetical protein